MFRTAILAALALVCVASNAEARQRGLDPSCNVTMPCQPSSESSLKARREARGRYVARQLGFGGPVTPRAPRVRQRAPVPVSDAAIVAHPSGCPSRAFCGCGAAVRVFGHSVRELWLAANWFKFPRTSPAPGMAAVRRHHVFVLEQHLGGDTWLAYDANSGGHATRIHARSIAGYTIVNPRGAG